MPPKNKFYQLSPRQKQSEKINDIYKLISHQQQTMAQLLSKYQNTNEGEQNYRATVQSPIYQIGRQRGKSESTRLQSINLQLPIISPHTRHTKKKYKKKGQQIGYYENIRSSRQKIRLKDHLDKAYGTDRSKINRSRTKIQTIYKEPIPAVVKRQQQKEIEENRKDQNRNQNKLPIPLGYLKDNVEQDSSSEQGEVPLTYYQKQYKGLIRQQSLEQTNFLYFSKNQSIKDWTQGLLLIFQKHDKELQSLRKKCKYLEKFDYNYFSIDIFKET